MQHWIVAFIGNFFEDTFIGLSAVVIIIEIVMVVANIKNRIFAIANWLMYV